MKRAGRRSFALLWAATGWLRAISASLRGRGARATPAPRSAMRGATPVFPALRIDERGDIACCGTRACVGACPSDALRVETGPGGARGAGDAGSGPGPGEGPARFELDPGACIGCGRCLPACPESALEGTAAPPALLTDRRGNVAPLDLLESARAREAIA